MKREIKFRAWDKISNKLGFVTNIEWLHEEHIRYILMDYNDFDDEDLGFNISRAEDDVVLMQFTGLKDKNGKDLYEDDIVRYDDDVDDATPHRLVSMELGVNGMGLIEYLTWTEFEIIGNIYENPELL